MLSLIHQRCGAIAWLMLAATLLLNLQVLAQNTTTNSTYYLGSQNLCNSSISNANASALYTFEVDFEDFNATKAASGNRIVNIPDPSWAITVVQEQDTTQTTIWYDTAGQNYADDLALEYDVCAYIIGNLPQNTLQLGQNDTGDCRATLSQPCISALTTRVDASALKWTSYTSPPPYQNLSAGVLPSICGYILNDLSTDGQAWPTECWQELNIDPKNISTQQHEVGTNIMALTGYNETILNEKCTLTSGNKTLYSASSFVPGVATSDPYATAVHDIHVALSVYFSVANAQRTIFTNNVNTSIRCLRASEFSAGSRVVETLPAGTPYTSGKHLSDGAIAGIVVGVVVGVAAVTAIGLVLWRRRRRQRNASKPIVENEIEREKVAGTEIDGVQYSELSPVDRKPELGGTHVAELRGNDAAELGGGGDQYQELEARDGPIELSADSKSGAKGSS